MAALTADSDKQFAPVNDEYIADLPVIASDIIYFGAAVAIVKASGYLRPSTGDDTAEDFAGFAMETVDNSSGANGDKTCRVATRGLVTITDLGGSPTIDNWGETVYSSTDNDFSLTDSTNDLDIGKVHQFESATKIVVHFRGVSTT